MKNLLLVLCAVSFTMAAGGDTVRLSSAYRNIADGDTIYTWWWKSPVDSIKKVVNGRIGNINIASDARISFQKLDSTGYLKARRINCDTLVCDTLRSNKKISCDTLNAKKIDVSRYLLSDSAAIRSLSGKSNTSIQIWTPQFRNGYFEGDFRTTGGANINLIDTTVDTASSGVLKADSIYALSSKLNSPNFFTGFSVIASGPSYGSSTITMYDSMRYFQTDDSIKARKLRGNYVAADTLKYYSSQPNDTGSFLMGFGTGVYKTYKTYRFYYTKNRIKISNYAIDEITVYLPNMIDSCTGPSGGHLHFSDSTFPVAIRPTDTVACPVGILDSGVYREPGIAVIESSGYFAVYPVSQNGTNWFYDGLKTGVYSGVIRYRKIIP